MWEHEGDSNVFTDVVHSAKALTRLGILQKMTNLQLLELRGLTSVTDASLESLAQFGHLKQIGIREDKIS
jgi:hypothetical protein